MKSSKISATVVKCVFCDVVLCKIAFGYTVKHLINEYVYTEFIVEYLYMSVYVLN